MTVGKYSSSTGLQIVFAYDPKIPRGINSFLYCLVTDSTVVMSGLLSQSATAARKTNREVEDPQAMTSILRVEKC